MANDAIKALQQKYNVPQPSAPAENMATSSTAKKASTGTPTLMERVTKQVTQQVSTPRTPTLMERVTKQVAQQVSTPRTPEDMKRQLLSMPLEARKMLYGSAQREGGKIILPKIEDPQLKRFGGLTFTEQEWATSGYNAKFGAGSLRAPTEQERITPSFQPQMETPKEALQRNVAQGMMQGNAMQIGGAFASFIGDSTRSFLRGGDEIDMWVRQDELRMQVEATNLRNKMIAERERQAGLNYLALSRASMPAQDMYKPFDWTAPETYLDQIARTVDILNRTTARSALEASRGLLGTIEAFTSSNPYLQNVAGFSARLNADIGIFMKHNAQRLNKLDTQKGFLEGGYADPGWYADALASSIPHMAGAIGASMAGFALSGGRPWGAPSGAFAYSTAVEGGSMYNEMLDRGFTIEQAREAAAIHGAIAGSLESIVPGKIGGKLLSSTANKVITQQARNTVKNEIMRVAGGVGLTMLKEGSTEALQELINNVVMSWYDKSQSYWENVPEAFFAGMAGGVMFGALDVASSQNVSLVRPPLGTEPGRVPAGETPPPSAPLNTPADGAPLSPASTFEDLATQLDRILDLSRAEEAGVRIGETILRTEGFDPVIQEAVQEGKQNLQNYNQEAKAVLEQYVKNTAQPVMQSPNVNVSIGQTPGGMFVASGDITMGNRSFSVPFDVVRAQELQSDAVAPVIEGLNRWVGDILTTEGITDEAMVQSTMQSLDELTRVYGDLRTQAIEFPEATRIAQDSDTLESFQETMTQENISIDTDLRDFFRRAQSADSVYLTAKEAEAIATDLAGDLGVTVAVVDEIATNKRALGRFVQEVYGTGGRIEIRRGGDRTQAGERNIRFSTPIHEAGHAYFRNMLLPEERAAILEEVRKKYKDEGMTDLQAEEKLVEDMKEAALKKKKSQSRYGRVISRLLDLAKKLVDWLGNNPEQKINQFYRDVLGKKRPSERRKAELARRKQGMEDVKKSYFQEPTKLTSKYFKFKEIAGKETVSFQQAMNAVKGANLKQAEADIITAVLESQFRDQKKINVAVLEQAVISELVPLEVKESEKYADYGLDRVSMDDWEGSTHIYDGPVEHGISGHFAGETTKLFGHTRVADNGDIRALLEVQSDFFQKTRDEALDKKLSPYANIWHERMLKEEIRLASLDGKRSFLVPTADTLAVIEGYTGTSESVPYQTNETTLEPGDEINYGSQIVVEANSDTITVVPIDKVVTLAWEEYDESPGIREKYVEFETRWSDVAYFYNPSFTEQFRQPNKYAGIDNFDVGLLSEAERAVYDFYKRKVNPYFERLRKGNVEMVTDANGFTWLETSITPQDAQAVEAFQTEEIVMYRGGTQKNLTELDIQKSIDMVESGEFDLGSVFAEGPGYYFTTSQEDASRYGSIVVKVAKKPEARILTNADKLTKEELRTIMNQIDRETLELAASDWAQDIDAGIEALLEEVYSYGDGAVDQIQSIWGDIFHRDDARDFLHLMQKVGIDGISINKEAGVTHTVLYNKDAVEELAVGTPFEAFQEMDGSVENINDLNDFLGNLPKQRLDAKKFTAYESFPAEEQMRYRTVAQEVANANNTAPSLLGMEREQVVEEVSRLSRVAETVYKYDQYLLRTYGVGLDQYTLQWADGVLSGVDEAVSFLRANEAGAEVSKEQVEQAKTIAKLLKPALSIGRKLVADADGKTIVDLTYEDMQNIFAVAQEKKETLSPAEQKAVDVWELLGEVDADMIVPLAQQAVRENNGVYRVDLNNILHYFDRLSDSVEASKEMSTESLRLREEMQKARVKLIERREMQAQRASQSGVKRRIHEQIMKNDMPTIEMTMRDFYKSQEQASARASQEAVKETRRILQEKYRQAKARKLITEKLMNTKKRLKKAITEGRLVDVETAKKLVELLDSFEKSAVSAKTQQVLDELLDAKIRGVFETVGVEDDMGNVFTEADAKKAEAYIKKIQERLTRRPLSEMSVDDMTELYSQISSMVEEGRIRLGITMYLNEKLKEQRIAEVISGTINLDDKDTVSTLASQNEKKFIKEGMTSLYLDVLAPSAVANKLDGYKSYDGQNSQMVKALGAQNLAFHREATNALEMFFTRLRDEVGINEFTDMESHYMTYLIRKAEGEGGAFVAQQVLDMHFQGKAPEEVGRITQETGEQIIGIMRDTLSDLQLTERVRATYESTTNKIFPTMPGYLMVSKFVNAPNAWTKDELTGVDMMQGYGRNATSINFGSAKERQADNPSLRPRTDFMRLFAETVENGLYYAYMQPALKNTKDVIASREYEFSAGKVASKWWKDYLSILSSRGSWESAYRIGALDKVRNNVTVALLSFRPSTVVMQFNQSVIGALYAFTKYGPKAGMRVLNETLMMFVPALGRRAETINMSNALFERSGTAGQMGAQELQRSIRLQQFEKKNWFEVFKEFGAKYGMWAIQEIDTSIYAGTWRGIYDTLVENGATEEQARIDADYFSNLAQSSTSMTDRPIFIAKGGSITKFFTSLQTFSLGFWSMFYEGMFINDVVKGDLAQKARAIPAMTLIMVANAYTLKMAREATKLLTGREDEEDFNILWEGFKDFFFQFPILGSVLRGMIEFNRTGVDNPSLGMVSKLAKGMNDVLTRPDASSKIKGAISALEGGGSLAGIPVIAPLALLSQRYTRNETDRIKFASIRRAEKLNIYELKPAQLAKEVAILAEEVYGNGTKVDKKTQDKLQKSLVKWVARKSDNVFMRELGSTSLNEEKANILSQAQDELSGAEFRKLVNTAKLHKIISEKAYQLYLSK